MDFESFRHREDVEKVLHEFLPQKITAEWVEKAVGKAKWHQDTGAITKAVSVPVWDFLSRGGKRWRPVLMLLCCEAVGGDTGKILPFAVIPELIHNGSLIVDDIEDNSELRRGKPVLHRIFGTDIALNAGNTLYMLPFMAVRDSKLAADVKNRVYEIIATQMLKCHFGQAIDIYWHSGRAEKIPTEQEYLQMCANKTGSVAAMAAKLGALLGGGTEQQIDALGEFAEATGVVFQIQDDILNIEGGVGKEYGDDIKEGKRSLLAIHALNIGNAKDKMRLLEILGMHTSDKSLIAEAIGIITMSGSIGYAKKIAAELAENAWRKAETAMPESEAKKRLKELAEMLISRAA